MSARSVLPFVRGIDLSETQLEARPGDLPAGVDQLERLEWLSVNSSNLETVPDRVGKLQRLERLSVNKNRLQHLHGELCTLRSLKSLHARRNSITAGGIPDELFGTADLQVLDLSHNRIRSFPSALEHCRSLMVLNLSHNQIASVPIDLFVNCTDLMYLDLSHNCVQQMPAQLRRCINLRKLFLSQNPEMLHSQLRSVMALKQLEALHLANTGRNLSNFPESLDKLTKLADLDLSENDLPVLPEALYQLRSLRKLNLSRNALTSLSTMSNSWPQLEVFDISHNQIDELPAALCKLARLRKLYVGDNRITFSGLPKSMGKLERLVVLAAANNALENIPESLCRCGQLRRLYLANNRLVTLPDAIHFLKESLDVFDIAGNPNLTLPPKPKELRVGAGSAFYNLDFSLETHKKASLLKRGAPVPSPAGEDRRQRKEDQAARWRRLKLRGRESVGDASDSQMVLDGMRRVAKTKQEGQFEAHQVKSHSWKDALQKPDLDLSEIFDDLVGQTPGLEVWEIEDRYPSPVEEDLVGVFFKGDCYIVLSTEETQHNSLDWRIHYWIGSCATTDKLFCASMHAVNLRNMLGAECRTRREEEGDESDEFLALFGSDIQVVDGEHCTSGLFQVTETEPPSRLYRLVGTHTVRLQAVPLSADELDPKFAYLLDVASAKTLFVWVGGRAKHMTGSKARLIADRIRKAERKGAGEVLTTMEGYEPSEFWSALGLEQPATIVESVDEDWQPSRPLLYRVQMGLGCLEIPRVRPPAGAGQPLTRNMLESDGVYLLDCGSDIYVWFGSKAQRFVRYAGLKLAQEAFGLFERDPSRTVVTRCLESAEPILFKLRFHGWDDIVQVDFTRTAESVQRRGADIRTIMEKDKMKMDLTDFFSSRPPPPSFEEAIEEANRHREDVYNFKVLLVDYRRGAQAKHKEVPPNELGHFYTKDCYIIICYYFPDDDDEEEEEEEEENEEEDEEGRREKEKDKMKKVVYFWRGREASELATQKFNFDTRKVMLQHLRDAEFRIELQQQESRQLLALFDRVFIVHSGRHSATEATATRLYQLRTNNADPLLSRCVEVPAAAASLCSAFCHAVVNGEELTLWYGRRSTEDDRQLMSEIGQSLRPSCSSPRVVAEGEEDDDFWRLLGGAGPYCQDVDFFFASRLFKLTTEQGFLTVADQGVDFCQDQLDDNAIMLLDTGSRLILWLGPKASDVLKKLSLQAAKLYLLALKDSGQGTRRLGFANKAKEPADFAVCFHAMADYKVVKDWRG